MIALNVCAFLWLLSYSQHSAFGKTFAVWMFPVFLATMFGQILWEYWKNVEEWKLNLRVLARISGTINSYAEGAVENSECALDCFAALPKHVDRTKFAYDKAVEHFNNGDYSLFWAQIETAYSSLAQYRSDLETVAVAAEQHGPPLGDVLFMGGSIEGLAEFPIDLDVKRAQATLVAALDGLGQLVNQAQKIQAFVQIWEQRRTAADVVEGFTNLEVAIDQMRPALSAQLGALKDALDSVPSSIEYEVLNCDQATNPDLASAAEVQVRRMKELANSSQEIQGEIYTQAWVPNGLLRRLE